MQAKKKDCGTPTAKRARTKHKAKMYVFGFQILFTRDFPRKRKKKKSTVHELRNGVTDT
jgi:hypothetical protein